MKPPLPLLLLLLALPLCLSGQPQKMVERRMYPKVPALLADTVVCGDIPGEASGVDVDFRLSLSDVKEKPGFADTAWGVALAWDSDTVGVTIRYGNSSFGDILDKRIARLTTSGGECHDFEDFATSKGEYNTLHLSFDSHTGTMEVYGGGKKSLKRFEISTGHTDMPKTWQISVEGEAQSGTACIISRSRPEEKLASEWTLKALTERFQRSHDPLEGFWSLFDRSNDPEYAHIGGRYVLAVVKDTETGEYQIVYISGAQTYGDLWKTGMVKGRLKRTIFAGQYDLEWTDAEFEPITHDIFALLSNENALLTLSFPLYKSEMRFSKATLEAADNQE